MKAKENLQKIRINLKGTFLNTGFGFSCIKLAHQAGVKGYLNYESAQKATMLVEGNYHQIECFLEQSMTMSEVTEMKTEWLPDAPPSHREFLIINHINQ